MLEGLRAKMLVAKATFQMLSESTASLQHLPSLDLRFLNRHCVLSLFLQKVAASVKLCTLRLFSLPAHCERLFYTSPPN